MKRILPIILCIILILTCTALSSCFEEDTATVTDPETGIVYRLSEDGSYWILKSLGENFTSSEFTVPSEFQGMPIKMVGDGDNINLGAHNLEKITIGNNVEKIGDRAISGMNLTEIVIEDSVTEIGDFAFDGNSNVRKLTLSKNLRVIGDNAFSYMYNVAPFVLRGEKLEVIGEGAFCANGGVVDLSFGKNLKEIGNSAFWECYNLRSLSIEAFPSVDETPFLHCYGLVKVTLGADVADISNLFDCNGRILEVENNSQVKIDYGNEQAPTGLEISVRHEYKKGQGESRINFDYEGFAFFEDGDSYYLLNKSPKVTDKEIVLPESYKGHPYAVFDRAFEIYTMYDYNPESITISDAVTEIGSYAFKYSNAKIIWGEEPTVKTFKDYAFSDYYGSEIVIPDSVEEVGDDAIYSLYIKKITVGSGLKKLGKYNFFYGLENYEPITLVLNDLSAWFDIEFEDFASNPLIIAGELYVGDKLITDLVIPNHVSSIKDYALCGLSCVDSITVGNGVSSMGERVFDGVSAPVYWTEDSALSTIPSDAYYGYKGTVLNLPASIRQIKYNAFNNLNNIERVNFMGDFGDWLEIKFSDEMANPATLCDNIYINSERLKTVTVPHHIKEIKAYSFSGLNFVEELILHESIEKIEENAFSMNEGLVYNRKGEILYLGCEGNDFYAAIGPDLGIENPRAEIDASCRLIADYAFDEYALSFVSLPYELENFGECSFGSAKDARLYQKQLDHFTFFENLTLLDGVIVDRDFLEGVGISGTLTLPDSVTEIESYGLGGNNFKKVVFGNGINKIGDSAFKNCTMLESIVVPTTLSYVSVYAFEGCNEALFTYCDGLKYLKTDKSDCHVLLDYYDSKKSSFIIDDTCFVIAEEAFHYYKESISVTIPASVFSICKGAFNTIKSVSCSVIAGSEHFFSEDGILFSFDGSELIRYPYSARTIYYLPDTVRVIRDYAFSYSGLSELIINDGVVDIGNYAFSDNRSLTKITIPDSVKRVGMHAFHLTTNLTFAVREGVKYLGNEGNPYLIAVEPTDKLMTNLIIDDECKVIADEAFYSCYNLVSVTLGEKLQFIGDKAFFSVHKLYEICNKSSLTLSSGADYLGGVAKNAINIYTPTGGESILLKDSSGFIFIKKGEAYVLIAKENVGSCTELTLPDSYNGHDYEIGDYAFQYCDSLKKIIIGRGAVKVGSYAISHCVNLKYIYISKKLTHIEKCGFFFIFSLKEVYYEGDAADWEKITIEDDNYVLNDATFTYNYVL